MKISNCGCSACQDHNFFHTQTNIDTEAQELGEKLLSYGISVPSDDPSDYCREKNGQIIFFELNSLDTDKLLSKLSMIRDGPFKVSRVKRLINRINEL